MCINPPVAPSREADLVAQYLPHAYRVADRAAGRRDDEYRSAAQLALLKAVRNYKPDGAASLKTYVGRRVRKAVYAVRRAERRRVAAIPSQAIPTDECGNDTLPGRGHSRNVEALINRLPAELAEVARLYFVEKRPVAAIAACIDRDPVVVRRRLARATKLLARMLEDLP